MHEKKIEKLLQANKEKIQRLVNLLSTEAETSIHGAVT